MNNNNLKEFLQTICKGINFNLVVICVCAVVATTFSPSLVVSGMWAVTVLVLFKQSANYLKLTELLFDQ